MALTQIRDIAFAQNEPQNKYNLWLHFKEKKALVLEMWVNGAWREVNSFWGTEGNIDPEPTPIPPEPIVPNYIFNFQNTSNNLETLSNISEDYTSALLEGEYNGVTYDKVHGTFTSDTNTLVIIRDDILEMFTINSSTGEITLYKSIMLDLFEKKTLIFYRKRTYTTIDGVPQETIVDTDYWDRNHLLMEELTAEGSAYTGDDTNMCPAFNIEIRDIVITNTTTQGHSSSFQEVKRYFGILHKLPTQFPSNFSVNVMGYNNEEFKGFYIGYDGEIKDGDIPMNVGLTLGEALNKAKIKNIVNTYTEELFSVSNYLSDYLPHDTLYPILWDTVANFINTLSIDYNLTLIPYNETTLCTTYIYNIVSPSEKHILIVIKENSEASVYSTSSSAVVQSLVVVRESCSILEAYELLNTLINE